MRLEALKLTSRGRLVLALLLILILPAYVWPQAPYYQGKTISIINGNAPGGTADMRMKAVMPYLKKYIPGGPTIVAEFMPGGGGRKAANHIYRVARPDGLTVGFPPGGFIMYAVLGETGVEYDLNKLIFLGSSESTTHYVFLTSKSSGLNGIEKLQAASGVRIGAQSIGHTVYIIARVFAYALRLKDPRFVTGYSGPEIDIALMRGEVDARANIADTVLKRNPEFVEKGLVNFHAIIEVPKGEKHPGYTQVPEIDTFVKAEKDRKVVDLFRALRLVGSPFILPPGTLKDRVEILREAFQKSFNDPGFWTDYKKLVGDEPSPLMADRIEKAIRELPRDPSVIELFKQVVGAGPLP